MLNKWVGKRGSGISHWWVRQSCKNECNELRLRGDCLCPAAAHQALILLGGQRRGSEDSRVLLQRAEPCRTLPLKMGSCTTPRWGFPHCQMSPANSKPLESTGLCRGRRVSAIEVKTLTLFTSNRQCLVLHKTIWNCIKYLQWLPRKQTLPILPSTSSGTDYF